MQLTTITEQYELKQNHRCAVNINNRHPFHPYPADSLPVTKSVSFRHFRFLSKTRRGIFFALRDTATAVG